MAIMQIAPVTRSGMKLLVSIFGLSETGKTLSALKLMAGIEPDPKKRGLMDSEGGERGRMYFDDIEGGYLYGSLTPPFTPERYAEGLLEFIKAGVTILTIDSASHAWFAAGGVLDMVEQATDTNALAKWAKPKRRLGKLTGHWLGCGIHLIICSRAKQPLIEVMEGNKKTYVPGPIVPIQEKSLRYDMTIMAHTLGDGLFSVDRKDGGKCPGVLRPVFASGEKMNEAMGKRLIDWIGGQDIATGAERALEMEAKERAGEGMEAYSAFWKALTKDQRERLLPKHDNLKSIAKAADDESEARRLAAEGEDRADPFGDQPALDGGIQHVGNETAEDVE